MNAQWKQCCSDFEHQIFAVRMKTIHALIKNFDFEGYRKKKALQFEMTQKILETFKAYLYPKVSRYDIFRELRVDFDENLISDVISSLLQPKKSPFRQELLICLLEHNKKFEIADIIKKTQLEKIICHREVSGLRSRIDIRIETHNEDKANAIIDLELKGKNPNADETYADGIPQTKREYKDLEACQKDHISRYNGMPCRIAAFYITPEGTQPTSRYFVEVSYDDIRELVEIATQKVLERDSVSQVAVVKAFFNSKWLF